MTSFLSKWTDVDAGESGPVRVLREKSGTRQMAENALQQMVLDHYWGAKIIERMGGFPKSLAIVRNKLPSAKRVRSGDLGEMLAAEYIEAYTDYIVPIKRLRYKDDRELAMRGDDVIAIDRKKTGSPRVLKVESKSRANLAAGVVAEAVKSLLRRSGRPNPASLAFVSSRLREQKKDQLAKRIEALQTKPVKTENLEHLVFTLSGNDPKSALAEAVKSPGAKIARHLVGLMVEDHQDLVETVFKIT